MGNILFRFSPYHLCVFLFSLLYFKIYSQSLETVRKSDWPMAVHRCFSNTDPVWTNPWLIAIQVSCIKWRKVAVVSEYLSSWVEGGPRINRWFCPFSVGCKILTYWQEASCTTSSFCFSNSWPCRGAIWPHLLQRSSHQLWSIEPCSSEQE